MKNKFVIAGVSWVLCLVVAGAAHATTITMQFQDADPAEGVTAKAWSGPNASDPGTLRSVGTLGGYYNWKKTGGDYAEIVLNQEFSTFCIDVAQTISYGGTYTYTVEDITNAPDPTTYSGGTISAAKKEALQKLYSRNLGLIAGDATKACGFQIAVWEIVFEHWTYPPNFDVTDGSFTATDNPGAVSAATTMLGTINASWAMGELVPDLVAFVSPCKQDQMWLVPGGDQPYVPEPVTMLGVFMGLMGVGGYVRRRLHTR